MAIDVDTLAAPFVGEHCETTALGALLQHHGWTVSEPMLFGLGRGLGFIYWHMKHMPFPFIGGRNKPFELTENACAALGVDLDVRTTRSAPKGWRNLLSFVDEGEPVGLQLDSYHLEYFTQKVHFAGHFAAVVAVDDDDVLLNDTSQQGAYCRTSRESLQRARQQKGHMAADQRSYTLRVPSASPVVDVDSVREAIAAVCDGLLAPPISNLGVKGMHRASKELAKWWRRDDVDKAQFAQMGLLMERAGTGGSLFRKMYLRFLREASDLGVDVGDLSGWDGVVQGWRAVSEHLQAAGGDGGDDAFAHALLRLKETAAAEEEALRTLQKMVQGTR